MTNQDISYIIELVRVGKATRTQQMIAWLLVNEDRVNAYASGNIQFSFTNGTLKVKDENYQEIK